MKNKTSPENISMKNFANSRTCKELKTTPVCLQKSFSWRVQQRQSACKTQLETFECSMRYLVIFGQYFGMFPIFRTKQMKKYPFFSWRYISTLLTCVSQLVAAILCLNGIIKTSINLGKFGRLIFYSMSCFCSILTMRLAAKWNYLLKQVAAADLNEYIDTSVTFKCKLATVIFLSLGLLNYVFLKISKFSTILNCESNNTTVFEQYILSSYDWFFGMSISYSLPIGILLHIVTLIASLNLSYCQIFVICMSLYLTSILKELNKKILSLDCKYVSSSYWRTLRQDYNRAIRLVHAFDDVINNIVLASFARNLFILCLQLYFVLRNDMTIRHGTRLCPDNYNTRSLRSNDHIITLIYLVYSTIFVIIRSIIVSLFAARIHSTSLEVVPILYSVPPPTYSIEIQRFIDQIHGNTVALSGQRFFYVTKEVILYMIGTVVTYELVLFQLK